MTTGRPGTGAQSCAIQMTIALALASAGCAAGGGTEAAIGPEDVAVLDDAQACVAAQARVEECTGAIAATSPAAEGCSPERARSIAAASCDELARAEALGKADGWWDSLMCALGFDSHCDTPAPSTDTPPAASDAPAWRILHGNVYRIGTTTGESGLIVRLSRGDELYTQLTFTGGGFGIGPVAPAVYRLEVYQGVARVYSADVDTASQSYVALFVPLL